MRSRHAQTSHRPSPSICINSEESGRPDYSSQSDGGMCAAVRGGFWEENVKNER